jgi:hypothetical protein
MSQAMKTALLRLMCLLANGICLAADPDRDILRTPPEAMAAWQNMRFGMFICWGRSR